MTKARSRATLLLFLQKTALGIDGEKKSWYNVGSDVTFALYNQAGSFIGRGKYVSHLSC